MLQPLRHSLEWRTPNLAVNIRLLGHLLTKQRVSRASQLTFAAAHLLKGAFTFSSVLSNRLGKDKTPRFSSRVQILDTGFWYGLWRVALAMASTSLGNRLRYGVGSLNVGFEPATEKAALGVVEVKIEQSQAAAWMLEASGTLRV